MSALCALSCVCVALVALQADKSKKQACRSPMMQPCIVIYFAQPLCVLQHGSRVMCCRDASELITAQVSESVVLGIFTASVLT